MSTLLFLVTHGGPGLIFFSALLGRYFLSRGTHHPMPGCQALMRVVRSQGWGHCVLMEVEGQTGLGAAFASVSSCLGFRGPEDLLK